ncbi:carbohydrate kinase [Arthrobacter sp. JZ12]|uniref:carbohydrate kinase family protein n=1 Tax=Arthrobacter sp. JZ12 TaxID=2654190 RepID=UPI002B46EAE5|nr:carbohydrate kinase [Arthrobacter sp. JZ12]WRH23716.1 carbohydrate kinase [Arthrobacter sp. JZ12]
MLTIIGEALIDEVISDTAPLRAHVGGSPLNVAVGLARLGHPTQFLGRFGDDEYGRRIHQHLADNAVLSPLPPDAGPTSVASARLDPVGGAQYTFQLRWELPELASRDSLLNGTSLVHTGSIASMLAPGAAEVLALVRQARPFATISYDPNCRPTIIKDVDYAREQAEKFVALADVVKASDEDLEWLYPGQDHRESARRWLSMGPAVVVVTRGSRGSWAVVERGECEAPAAAASVVDTVGAGDSFMAALLGALVDRELDGGQRRSELHGLSVEQVQAVLAFAAAAAAVTVSRAGANPPTRDELRARGVYA